MEIKTVSIIGLGALGMGFGHLLLKSMPKEDLRIIAGENRINRYNEQGIYVNGELCSFHYVTPEEKGIPADLVLFMVKFNQLQSAIEDAKNQIGNNTIIMSALNGISSEEIIGETYGMENMLYCVAQGQDGIKAGNRLNYHHMGMLCFGDREPGGVSEKVKTVAKFFENTNFPHEVETNMDIRLWGKFMLNVGVNQTVAVYEGTYGDIQKQGQARDTMIAAMREVLVLSGKVGVKLSEDDLDYWLSVVDVLNGAGKPSMRQDLEARRYSEVELFSGTVLKLGQKYGVATPVNQKLYDRITQIENQY